MRHSAMHKAVSAGAFLLQGSLRTALHATRGCRIFRALLLASASLEESKIEGLPLPKRLKLEVATRQFDTALYTVKRSFAPPTSRLLTCG